MSTTRQTVAVLGLGTLGSGIAEMCALAGHQVVAVEADPAERDAGRDRLAASLDRAVGERRLAERQRADVLDRVAADVADLAAAAIVIEAAPDDEPAKRDALSTAAGAAGEGAIIATTTSVLPVTDLAAAVPHPGRVGGLHFVHPVPGAPLVEVVRAVQTDENTVSRLAAFADELGTEAIVVADRPGFVVNRLLMPYLNDVVQAYDDGLASARDIDVALELGLGYPSGPLRLLDDIGLDVHHRATTAAYEASRDPTLAPPPLLARMVAAGHLGNKAGNGFRTGQEGHE